MVILLFAPFERLKNDLNQEGSGVGLSLVKRIIDGYKGTIQAESEPDKGLTFHYFFTKIVLLG